MQILISAGEMDRGKGNNPRLWTVRNRFWGQDCKICFPVFSGEMQAVKSQTVKSLRVEIFSICSQKYYLSCDGLDTQNGDKTLISFL